MLADTRYHVRDCVWSAWFCCCVLAASVTSRQGLANVFWTAVFVGSAAYIARKDLVKVFRVLKSPTQNFIKDVKHELDKTASSASSAAAAAPPAALPPTSAASGAVADAVKAAEGAEKRANEKAL